MPAPRSGSFASPVDGLTITTWTWDDVPGQPLGVVQLVHGLAEHSRRYGRLATALNAAGFLITGADTRGARRVGFNRRAAGLLRRRRGGRVPG